jgi:hypothetical protein
MSEITKAVGQFVASHVSLSVLIFLAILSGLFKISKIEIDPLGKFIGWIGGKLTKDVRNDVANLKIDTTNEFRKIKQDRSDKVKELMEDYNSKITDLRTDLDAFEVRTNNSICEIKNGTNTNCEIMKKELAAIKKSNDMQTIRQIRAHVLDFANSCLNKRKHTKKEFDNIIRENAQYEALVKKHRVKNAVYKEDFAFIMKVYDKCRENNSFLKDPEAVDADVDLCESES